MAQQPAQSTPPPHAVIGGLASKLLSGIGLATEEMPLAGSLFALIAEMFSTFQKHQSGQQ